MDLKMPKVNCSTQGDLEKCTYFQKVECFFNMLVCCTLDHSSREKQKFREIVEKLFKAPSSGRLEKSCKSFQLTLRADQQFIQLPLSHRSCRLSS